MALSIKDLKQITSTEPPRLLIFGQEKSGKTTLASEFPRPVFLQTEMGVGRLKLDSFGLLTSYEMLMEALEALYQESHTFQNVVIDSVTALQPLIWTEVCKRGNEKGESKKRIEDFGYGRGYTNALYVWQEIMGGLAALRSKRGMGIVLIAHSKIERFDDPESVSYSRYEIDLHDKARDFLKRESDAILLLKPDVTIKTEDQGFNKTRARADGGRQIWMHTTSRPSYTAGNRYDMPEKILFERGKGYEALKPYLTPPSEQTNGSKLVKAKVA